MLIFELLTYQSITENLYYLYVNAFILSKRNTFLVNGMFPLKIT